MIPSYPLTSWPPSPADFAGVACGAQEASEVTQLLGFKGGSSFNLS